MIRRLFLLYLSPLFLVTALAGCSEFPELDRTAPVDRGAAYPALIPLDDVLAEQTPRIEESDPAALEARAEELRARAQRLRGTVLSEAEKLRLAQAVTSNP